MTEALKYLREQNNFSQNTIAGLLGISRQMYIKYEKGEVNPPVKIITQLANIYKVPYEVIIDGKFTKSDEQKGNIKYQIKEANKLEFHDSGETNPSSYYFNSIIQMLPKLIYNEQLKLLSSLLEIVQKQTELQFIPNKKVTSFNNILELSKSLQLKSDGKKWTREELYER